MQQQPTVIRRVGQGQYVIPSRTRAHHDHHIDLVAGTCSCEASQHGRRCWAYGFAEAYSTTMGAYLKSCRQPSPDRHPDGEARGHDRPTRVLRVGGSAQQARYPAKPLQRL